MTDTNNTISLVKFPRAKDPAADAYAQLLAAGKNDALYMSACDNVERLPARGVAGMKAKLELLNSYLSRAARGDALTECGWDSVRALCAGMRDGLDRMASR